MEIDVQNIRKDFPFFYNNPDVVYLDNAATTQKNKIVIEKEKEFYEKYNYNIHRTASSLALKIEEMYEETRNTIANFINCDPQEIFFTYNSTYGLNYLAYFIAINYLQKGDEVILTEMEHHASLLPFINLSKIFDFKIKLWKLNDNLSLDINNLEGLIGEKTKLLVITHMSNVLGVINDIQKVSNICKSNGLMVLVDGAQGIVHEKVDLRKWDIDFYVFSAHKLYGPTGLGVVYVNKRHFDQKIPAFSGGSMISYVSLENIKYLPAPMFFEPGTQALAQIFAFKYSIDYLNTIGHENIRNYELKLTEYLFNKMKELDFLDIYGYDKVYEKRFCIIPFNVKGLHSHDVAFVLDSKNISIRVGHHCAQLIHHKLKIPGSCRVSLAFYNTYQEVDLFINALKLVEKYSIKK